MVRIFNTRGPINPEKHYYVERTKLLARGMAQIEESCYFTIFAPRQTGKTTYFQQLIKKINNERKEYFPVWISFEGYGNPDLKDFFEVFQEIILEKCDVVFPKINSFIKLPSFFKKLTSTLDKDVILIIDEFEGLQNTEIINGLLHTFRNMYHNQEIYHLRSVILTGVSNITGVLQDNASPFNIADQIEIPYFNREQTFNLLNQHEIETGQQFIREVKENIQENTAGQPGLVNALARDLVEVEASDKKNIEVNDFYKTLEKFMRQYLDKNIMNIVNKAKKYPDFVLNLLFGETIDFDIADERIQYLYVNGVIDNCQGKCCIKVPIYKKRIYNYFKPKINGEKKHYLSFKDNAENYLDSQGKLKFKQLMDRYLKYIKERGGKMFFGRQYYEGVYQYNLDEFLYSYLTELGGKIYPETSVGGGKVDLLLILNNQEYIVEVKANISQTAIQQAKKQLVTYLKRQNLDEGYLVIYDDQVTDFAYFEEKINKNFIYTWVIKTKFSNPSKS